MKYLLLLSLALTAGLARAVSIDAIYFAQTHVQKATDTYFGTVGGRDVFMSRIRRRQLPPRCLPP
jgi:hypothetical protein